MMDAIQEIIAKRQEWVDIKRREGVEGVFRATALALPMPPSLHDALLVPRTDRPVIAQLCAKTICAKGGDAKTFTRLIERLTQAGVSAFMVSVGDCCDASGFGDILAAAQTTHLPIICKDVVLDPLQVTLARAHGAAAVVLSPGHLSERALKILRREASEMLLDVVFDVTRVSQVESVAKARAVQGAADCRILSADLFNVNAGNSARFRERFCAVVPEFTFGILPMPTQLASAELEAWSQLATGVLLVDASVPDISVAEERVSIVAGSVRV